MSQSLSRRAVCRQRLVGRIGGIVSQQYGPASAPGHETSKVADVPAGVTSYGYDWRGRVTYVRNDLARSASYNPVGRRG